MNKLYTTLLLFFLSASAIFAVSSGEERVQPASDSAPAAADSGTDRIIAVVNDRIVLKSDVDQETSDYLRQMRMNNQSVEFSEDLWYNVLESIIDNYVLLEKARMDSVEVSDELVNRQMDLRVQQMIQQAGSEEALEQAFGQSIVEMRSEVRDDFREQLITQQVRESKMRSVSITRPEVREFFENIPEDSLPTIPEQVSLSQIISIPPPLEDAERAAREKAEQIRDSIVVHDRSFEEMARRHSTGNAANNGGLLPMMPLSDLVSEYAAAAAALEPGEVSGIVRTSFGFHIIRLNQRTGDNIETNNILITIDDQGIDEQAAIDKLNALRDSVLIHDKSFRDLAREHSDDDATRNLGGRIFDQETGDRLISLNSLEPALYRIALLLDEEGDISEPRAFTTQNDNRQAYRIVRLDEHVPEHRANLEQDYDRIRQSALQQKQMETLSNWLANLRDDVHIEYKIDVPDQYREPQPEFHDFEVPPEDPTQSQPGNE